jgi:hypothetical protein
MEVVGVQPQFCNTCGMGSNWLRDWGLEARFQYVYRTSNKCFGITGRALCSVHASAVV